MNCVIIGATSSPVARSIAKADMDKQGTAWGGMVMTDIREFSTGWGDDQVTWSNRTREELTGTARGSLHIPMFRPFDMLTEPNQRLRILANDENRVGVESVVGIAQYFHRNADFDEVFFQWSGRTTVETEFGVFEMRPADLLLIPSGVAHRSIGTADSLRLFVHVQEPLNALITEDDLIGHTEYEVARHGAPEWTVPDGQEMSRDGKVEERIRTWDDEPGDLTVIERNHATLVDASTEGRVVRKVRLFDVFDRVTGRKGPGPVVLRNDSFLIECYNTDGAQFAFHRGNRNDEFQLQFQGTADNISEFGADLMKPGDLTIVPRGIAHNVIGSPTFRRIVLYSKPRWKVTVDPTKHACESTFEVVETVIERAAWRDEIAAAE